MIVRWKGRPVGRVDQNGHRDVPWEVERAYRSLVVRREAARLYEAQNAGPKLVLPTGTIEHDLRKPPRKLEYTVEGLHTRNSTTLFSALFKTGKSQIALTLMKALADNERFLGHQTHLREDCRVGYLNYEMSDDYFMAQIRRLGIVNRDRVARPVHLRGRSLPFWDIFERDKLVAWLGEVGIDFLIIDTLTKAGNGYVGNWNDAAEVGAWYHALDECLYVGECSDCLVLHHMGSVAHSAENGQSLRARGSTVIEDHPDALWYMKADRKRGGNAGDRTFWAIGRGVSLDDEIMLEWDPERGVYLAGGVVDNEGAQEAAARVVVEALATLNGKSGVPGSDVPARELWQALPVGAGKRDSYIRAAEDGAFVVAKQIGKAKLRSVTLLGRQLIGEAMVNGGA